MTLAHLLRGQSRQRRLTSASPSSVPGQGSATASGPFDEGAQDQADDDHNVDDAQ